MQHTSDVINLVVILKTVELKSCKDQFCMYSEHQKELDTKDNNHNFYQLGRVLKNISQYFEYFSNFFFSNLKAVITVSFDAHCNIFI